MNEEVGRMPKSNWPSGLKKTRQRERVMEALRAADNPLSALEIALVIERAGETAWLSTVYRALESFVSHGVAVRIAVTGSDVSLYELRHPHHRHYAVCVDCRRIIAMSQCPVEDAMPAPPEEGFTIIGHNLEVLGRCKDCSAAGGKAPG
jgi:Fur family ferric uptake transcriptional regulator